MSDESGELSRELPPLDTEKRSDVDQSKNRSKAKKVVFIAITIAMVLLFVAIATVITVVNSSGESAIDQEGQPLSAFDAVLDVESESLVNVSVLDMEEGGQDLQDQTHDLLVNDGVVASGLMPQVTSDEAAFETFDLSLMSSDLRGVSERVDELDSMLKMLKNGLFSQVSDVDIKLSERLNQHDNKVSDLEEQVAYLVKEVKRMKWLERQKRVSRKKVEDLPVVTSFFIWQYRPGVELLYKGSSGRFYEGDLLDGMRVLKIDNHLERVVLSKKGKEVVLTLLQGAG